MADTPPAGLGSPPARSPGLYCLTAAALFSALMLIVPAAGIDPTDFYIFRLGAELTARGENPYNVATARQHIAAHFPGEDRKEFRENCGYFLPPMAILLFMPFAALPWVAAKVAWAVVNGVAAYFVTRLPFLYRSKDAPPPRFFLVVLAPFLLLFNPVALIVPVVGQFSVVFVGCVAAGLLAFERGRPYLVAALWVVPFVKPHLALPLVPLAWYLGGWRPAALLVALVGALNLAGAWVVGGSPLFLKDYFEFLPQARAAVGYNRAELNPEITSWNRLLYALGGPLIELSAVGIAAGFLVWFGLAIGRCAVANDPRPSVAWAVAVAAAGAVLCAQVLPYEFLFVAVAVPWVRDLFLGGHRIRGWLAVGLMVVECVPYQAVSQLGLSFHRSLCVLLFALLVLTGPVRLRHAGCN